MGFMFYAPTRLLFGEGMLKELHTLKLPGSKAAIIISNGKSVCDNGYLKSLEEELEIAKVNYCVFNKVGANPTKKIVEEGAVFIKQNKCDFVIALGGGSVMDAAKNMALLTTQKTCDLWDYAISPIGRGLPIENDPLPWVSITTTAGTGSEVDQWGVITNEETHEKIGCGIDERLFAKIAIVDSTLMYSVPPLFTSFQGFDALFHCTEGYLSCKSNYMTQMFDLCAIQKIATYLPRAVANGNDKEARSAVAFSNTLGGYSMVAGSTISCHALEHAMSAYYPKLPHGAGLIMICEEYYKYWVKKGIVDNLLCDMARAMGKTGNVEAKDFVTKLHDIKVLCKVDNICMSDYGITKEDLEKFVSNAFRTTKRLFDCDRVQMTKEEALEIYEKSYK